jgi:hypothetical protein
MDSNPNWEYEGDWAFGQPTGSGGDPSSGATGKNVIGYNLAGQYEDNLPEFSVTSQPIDCSNFTDVQVSFERWLGIESSSFDQARFSVSADGAEFVTIWSHTGGSVQESTWQTMEYDISEIADGSSDVRLRWVMGTTDGSVTFCGWNIDDVELIGVNSSPGIPGDINGDGLVNGADVGLLLTAWGLCENCPADLNGDGQVDGEDFGLLLSYWSQIPFAPSHSSVIPQAMPNQPEVAVIGEDLLDLRLINRDVLGPRHHNGLITAPHGYLQYPKARLELEVAGQIPLTEHDLLIVNGEAYVSGTLEIRVPEGISLSDGDYVVMCADLIHGAFDEVSITAGDTKIVQVCVNDHAVIVRIGESQPNRDIRSITPTAIIEMIDRFGENDSMWDMNGDSRIDALDLAILLRSSHTCKN